MSTPIRSFLESLVSPEALIPEAELEKWRVGGRAGAVPEAVVAPSSEEELADLLGRASQEGWKVLPAGLGSWLQGGGPSAVSLVVSTRRMSQVQEYEPPDLTFTAGAGLPLSKLREMTGANGQWLPLDPPGGSAGSLGAAVAIGGGGPLRQLYGTARDHVLGLTMVSGDGRILRWGGKVVKNVAGFDLTRLAIGSWGSLGVVTRVSARLFPIPEADVSLVLRGPDLKSLLPLARTMALSSLPLAAVELLDPLPVEGEAATAGDGEGLSAVLVLRLLGSEAQVEAMEARIRADLTSSVGRLEKLEGEGSLAFHEGMNRWEEELDLVARLSRLPSELASLLDEADELKSATGSSSTIRLSAQVGSGALRIGFPKLSDHQNDHALWASTLHDLRSRLESQGGTLTLSSGPESLMKDVGAWGPPGPEGEIMAQLKATFDPGSILAPGRLGL